MTLSSLLTLAKPRCPSKWPGFCDEKPLASERLRKPVRLTHLCRRLEVVEWRASTFERIISTRSTRSIREIDRTCNYVVAQFIKMYRDKLALRDPRAKGPIKYKRPQRVQISLLPYRPNDGGRLARNLNDWTFRFANRARDLGRSDLWGYYSRIDEHIYLRNDVLGKHKRVIWFGKLPIRVNRFHHTLAHELYHALSHQFKLFQRLGPNRAKIDEQNARSFVHSIGFGWPLELNGSHRRP